VKSFKKNWEVKRVHGSRDYFSISKNPKVEFEIIPVFNIKNPREAKNVTDLSYFHVNYVKNKIKVQKLEREIALAKSFFKAQKIYGAESYIKGFSGYALECLVIHYGSFEKLCKNLVELQEKSVIDPEKHYRNKEEVFLSLTEAKLQSPIILIDPTWKERNALAGLGQETFEKTQKIIKSFLKSPSKSYFESSVVDIEKIKKQAKKSGFDFIELRIKTDRQAGDIAGTKMKKFSNMLKCELLDFFEVKKDVFVYSQGQEAVLVLVLKRKSEVVRKGPPTKMDKACKNFKKDNKGVFEKKGWLYSRIPIKASAKKFLGIWIKSNRDKIKDMGIVDIVF
jgi:tRNA nucleotidyltransferase (CCA-adding enzyme)